MKIEITKSTLLRNRIVSLLYIVFLSTAYMSIPDRFLDNSVSLNQTLDLSAKEHELSFEEDRYLSEIFDIREVEALASVNRICDSSTAALRIVEQDFIDHMGGLDEYGLIERRTNTVEVLNYWVTQKNWIQIKDVLDTLSTQLHLTLENDSITNLVDTMLFPERPILEAQKGRSKMDWGKFYFKNTPAMQAHVQVKNVITKIGLVKSLATRYLVQDKLREVQIQNFIEVTEMPDTLAELTNIRVAFKPDFNSEFVQEINIPFNTKELMARRNMMLSRPGVSASMRSFRDYEVAVDLSRFVDMNTIPEIKPEPERRKPQREIAYLLKPKSPILYVDIVNKIDLEGDFDYNNTDILPSYGDVSDISNGSFYFECSTPGYVHFEITDEAANEYIGTFTFPVQELPAPHPKVSQTRGGNISVLTVRRLQSLSLYFKDIDWLNALDYYSVKSFDVIHVETSGKATQTFNRTAAFTDAVLNMTQNAKSGDRIIFKSIKVYRQGEEYEIEPLILEVI